MWISASGLKLKEIPWSGNGRLGGAETSRLEFHWNQRASADLRSPSDPELILR